MAPAFPDDFQQHWPKHGDYARVGFIGHGLYGDGESRTGDPRWRRMFEERCKANSVFLSVRGR